MPRNPDECAWLYIHNSTSSTQKVQLECVCKSAVQMICFEHLSERRGQTMLSSGISKYSSFLHISFYKFQFNCSTKMNVVLCRPFTTVV